MRYKDYVWPHNPKTYTIEYERKLAAHKVPFGRYYLQDLGLTRRVMKGEGEFVGEGAYDEFRKLAAVFYEEGAGLLVHPVWQSTTAYFVDLQLTQEPSADYVRYSFTFWETYEGYGAQLKTSSAIAASASGSQYYTVVSGDTMWKIANAYGLTLSELVALNPQIKNPNLITPGEQVRVQ